MVVQKPSHSLRIGIIVEYISAIKHAVCFGVIFWEFWLMEVGMLGPLGGGVVLEVWFKEFVIKGTVKVGFLVVVLVVIFLLVEGLAVADWVLHLPV
jgi:hypothetical protein